MDRRFTADRAARGTRRRCGSRMHAGRRTSSLERRWLPTARPTRFAPARAPSLPPPPLSFLPERPRRSPAPEGAGGPGGRVGSGPRASPRAPARRPFATARAGEPSLPAFPCLPSDRPSRRRTARRRADAAHPPLPGAPAAPWRPVAPALAPARRRSTPRWSAGARAWRALTTRRWLTALALRRTPTGNAATRQRGDAATRQRVDAATASGSRPSSSRVRRRCPAWIGIGPSRRWIEILARNGGPPFLSSSLLPLYPHPFVPSSCTTPPLVCAARPAAPSPRSRRARRGPGS